MLGRTEQNEYNSILIQNAILKLYSLNFIGSCEVFHFLLLNFLLFFICLFFLHCHCILLVHFVFCHFEMRNLTFVHFLCVWALVWVWFTNRNWKSNAKNRNGREQLQLKKELHHFHCVRKYDCISGIHSHNGTIDKSIFVRISYECIGKEQINKVYIFS